MDEEGFGWDEAYQIVKKMFHYTNHTIMTEAMECWDENMFRFLLPRIIRSSARSMKNTVIRLGHITVIMKKKCEVWRLSETMRSAWQIYV